MDSVNVDEDEDGGSDDEQEEHEQARRDGVGVGEPLDALVDPADRRDDEAEGQHGDDDGCGRRPVALGAEDVGQAAGDLQRPEAEGGGRPEQGGDDREDVDRPTRGAVGAVADERAEGRADEVAAALAVGEVGDRQADDRVHRPRVEAPVEEGVLERQVGGLLAPGLGHAHRRGVEVGQWLGDPVEHQADAHAGGEHHRHPGEGRELRGGVVRAELDVAVAARGEEDAEDEEGATREDEEPAEVRRDPAQDGAAGLAEPLVVQGPVEQEDQGQPRGGAEDDLVDPLAPPALPVLVHAFGAQGVCHELSLDRGCSPRNQ